jgi:hypothetical protein
MEEELQKYLDSLTEECLTSNPSLNRVQMNDYFNQVILETLIYSLNDEQIKQIENIDFNKPEDIQKLQLLAASIPGFIFIVEDILKQEVGQIKKTGQIPTLQS